MPLKKKNAKWPRLLPRPFFLLAIALGSLLTSYTDTDKEQLYRIPFFSDTNGWDIYTLEGERVPLAPIMRQ